MKYTLLLVAGALLFVQFAYALPHMKRESVAVEIQTQNSTDDSSLSKKEKLHKAILMKFDELSRWAYPKISVLKKNTLKELNEIPVKDELLQETISLWSEFVEPLNKSTDNIVYLRQFVGYFEEMIDYYENMPVDSKLKQTLQTALENNGYKEIKTEFDERYSLFIKYKYESLGEYVKDLSPEEKVQEVQLVKYFEELKKIFDEAVTYLNARDFYRFRRTFRYRQLYI